MKDLGTALALLLVIEGVLYALFPEGMRRIVVQMLTVPAPILRALGLGATCVGVIVVWLIRR
jgi:uncharacterized protein YjeT (DUF2065 family)